MKKIITILIILIILVILLICSCPKHKITNDETTDSIRKHLRKYHKKSKKIYYSPQRSNESIKSLENNLKTKLSDRIHHLNSSLTSKHVIKFYYSNNCGFCQHFKPIWHKFKHKYDNVIKFIEIDCTDQDATEQYVNGYPTIAIFKDSGEYLGNYTNRRDDKNFEAFLKTLY